MTSTTIGGYVEQHGAALSRLCSALCGNQADAQDLYQETWLKVIRFIGQYDDERPFDKWLFTICANSYRNMRQSAWVRRHYEFPSAEHKERFFDSLPGGEESSEEHLAIAAGIAQLPAKLRTMLVLKYVSGYSEAELSQLLDIPVGTVKSRLHSAKQQLREILQ